MWLATYKSNYKKKGGKEKGRCIQENEKETENIKIWNANKKKEIVTFLKQRERNKEGSKKESVYRRDKHEKGEDKGKRCQKKGRGIYLAQHNMTMLLSTVS